MPLVVVIEDDNRVRIALTVALESFGHTVHSCENAVSGLKTVTALKPDVAIVDLGLPDLDGVALVKMIRRACDCVVIAATARVGERDIISTLDAGADDYLVKPFSPEQLDARIRASLRRKGPSTSSTPLHLGDLFIDEKTRTVTNKGVGVNLSRKEFDLLLFLVHNADRVVTKRELIAEVWRQPVFTTDKTIDVHISWLRRKLGETAQEPVYIHSVRGVGIKFECPGG